MSEDLKTGETVVRHHKNRHLYERFEGLIGVLMVAAVVVLAIGLIYGLVTTGDSTPSYLR
ncbi:hypothetical protein [Phenylobacterium sp.]|uniref:hypothetical protein n=1 Tax=Phenylobacterium sp. TaxID=1871053 RepID=UPI00286DE815|nr:hypothetical protein [Phenylobacterium sp.]